MPIIIKPTKRGFVITRTPCVVCGEPPFGDEYCCGHKQTKAAQIRSLMEDSGYSRAEATALVKEGF